MCKNAYTYIFLWVPWQHYIHFCQCTHKTGQTFKADPKEYNFMRDDICHKQTPIWKGSVDFTACLPIFLDSAYIKTPIYQIWYFPPKWRSLPLFVTYLLHYMGITPENFMIWWWEHNEKGVTDRRTDGLNQSWSCLVAAKNSRIYTCRIKIHHTVMFVSGISPVNNPNGQNTKMFLPQLRIRTWTTMRPYMFMMIKNQFMSMIVINPVHHAIM